MTPARARPPLARSAAHAAGPPRALRTPLAPAALILSLSKDANAHARLPARAGTATGAGPRAERTTDYPNGPATSTAASNQQVSPSKHARDATATAPDRATATPGIEETSEAGRLAKAGGGVKVRDMGKRAAGARGRGLVSRHSPPPTVPPRERGRGLQSRQKKTPKPLKSLRRTRKWATMHLTNKRIKGHKDRVESAEAETAGAPVREIEITPGMIKAGVEAYLPFWGGLRDCDEGADEEMVIEVFRAMTKNITL